MVDKIPAHVWLLIAVAAAAFPSVQYVYDHIFASPSRRDITKPVEELSWRTSGNLVRSLSIIAALAGFTIFMFTPAAEQFAKSPRFLPILLGVVGAWALSTVPLGLAKRQVQPFIKGVDGNYQRDAQPKRYWASIAWNGSMGALLLWLAYTENGNATERVNDHRCYNETEPHSAQEKREACTELIGTYDEAIRLDPRDSYAHYNRALAYERLGDRRRAVAGYSDAIRLDPKDDDPLINRGLIFLDTGKFEQAVADFSRAHTLDPKSPWPLANRGITYAQMNDRVLAQQDFNSVRAIDRTNPVMLRGEALLAFTDGDMTLAVDRSTASLDREPDKDGG